MNQKKRIILFISFGLVFLLTGVFIFFIFFHSFHFLKNTRINGIDVGCKTVDEVTVLLNANKPDYSFVLHTAAGDTVFTDEMLDFDFYVSKGEVQAELNKQNPFEFVMSWFADDNESDVRYNAAFDKDKLDSILDGLSLNTNRKKSMDAVINYAHGIPKIIPETVGNYLDLDLLYATVNDAIISLSPSVDVDNGDFYVQPKVVSSDLEAKQKALEKVLVRDIKIRAVSTDIPLDSFDVYGFSNIEDDVFVSYDKTKVERYIRTFAEEYNSVDGQHIFKTSDGKVIKPNGGTYGYSIDVEKTSAAFFKKLSDLQFKGRIDVIYRETGYKDALSHSVFDKKNDGKLVGDDIGNTYIESQFDKLIADVRGGATLSSSIDDIDGFVKKLPSSINVGEETGALDQMLVSIADQMDYDSEIATEKLVAMIEPLMIVVMAVMVGFIMIAIIQPIYGSYQSIADTTM